LTEWSALTDHVKSEVSSIIQFTVHSSRSISKRAAAQYNTKVLLPFAYLRWCTILSPFSF
jgi:hypothetical protein